MHNSYPRKLKNTLGPVARAGVLQNLHGSVMVILMATLVIRGKLYEKYSNSILWRTYLGNARNI